MAIIELRIYGEEDEILRTYKASRVRWGLVIKALELQEAVEKASGADQLNILGEFVLELFPTMSKEDLYLADPRDIVSVFKQVGHMAKGINGSKNA